MRFLKVLKYEFLEYFFPVLVINGILFVLIFSLKYIGYNSYFDTSSSVIKIFTVIMMFITLLGVFCYIIFLGIIILKSLYSRLFSSEGYLTLSIPVSIDYILCSKIIVSTTWVLLSIVITTLWLYSFVDTRFFFMLKDISSFYLLWKTFISIINNICLIFLILAILNTGKIVRFKTITGILLFFMILFVSSIASLSIKYLAFGRIWDFNATTTELFLHDLIDLFITIIYYIIARYLIKNKLEV
ncbi:hypothetical protein [Helicobacter sp. MIT 14-3879]|uniref:hypothetical protein n=1 Tax=Helicobacter sp. MIT 14-3879 TaxID=2040649 RepID=UPI000E1E8AF8|nr:hypothetical protein [Helicobacter sp. MIT 14-3879]RDU61643.1 hypothetical protein CQA44_08360 [Helicobacter sp. MIT 14-3879]